MGLYGMSLLSMRTMVEPSHLCEGQVMRIGELAERTGTSRRLLRYYEEEGLLEPGRTPNGYRDYDDRFVERVAQIRGLLDAGIPVRIIRQLLPCLDTPWTIYCPTPTSEMTALLERERDKM